MTERLPVLPASPALRRVQQLPPQQRLIALDIDGTVMDFDGNITAAVRDAVHQVIATGAHVVIATGRSLFGMRAAIDQLGVDSGWAVSSNGAVTSRLDRSLPDGYELADVITFDPQPALQLLARRFPSARFALEDLGRGHLVNELFPAEQLTGNQRVVSIAEMSQLPATRVAVHSPDHTAEEFFDEVERIGLHGVSYAVGWTAWLDLTPHGVSKASALEVVRQRLGVPRHGTIAAGDGRNDLEMFEWAAVSGAMGQAPAEVKARADIELGPIEADGLVPLLLASCVN